MRPPTSNVIRTPSLLISDFSSLAPKKIEQWKIESQQNGMKYIFLNAFVFNFIFEWACENKTKWLMFESSLIAFILSLIAFSMNSFDYKDFSWNKALFTASYCCVRYSHERRKNNTSHLLCISPLSFFYAKGVYSLKLSREIPY